MQRRIQVHLDIQGDVHATGFRSAMQREATRLGAVGWVRNREAEQAVEIDPAVDGPAPAPADVTLGVEAVVQGSEMVVLQLQRWCERGPLSGNVRAVVATSQPREAFFGFDVRR
jgi:acylphosphatase